MITDVYYTIHTKTNGTITVEYNLADWNNLTRGENASFEFHVPSPSDNLIVDETELIVSDTQTISAGQVASYNIVIVESGATLTVDGELNVEDLTVNGTVNGSGQVNVVAEAISYTVESGTLEIYDTVTVNSGDTLQVNGTLQTNQLTNNGTIDNNGTVRTLSGGGALPLLRQYDDFGGGYATIETLTSETKYRDQLPSDASVDTQAIGIEPSQTLKDRDVTGVWALVDSVDDTRPLALSDERVRIETTVLSEYSEYNNHSELETDLQV